MSGDVERKARKIDNNKRDDGSDTGEPLAPGQAGRNLQSGGRNGNSLPVEGNSFYVKTSSGHAVICQGIQGGSMKSTTGSGKRIIHEVGEARDYSTVLQGATTPEFAKVVFQNQLELFKTDTAAANASQSNKGEQDPSAGNEQVDASTLDREKPNSSRKRNSDGNGNT
jgi:hypothetical protein